MKGMNDRFLFFFCDRTRDLDLDRFEMASQGDSHVRGLINIADYTVQRLSMSDPVGLNFCNRFSIVVCLFCAIPKYNPGDEILNRRGQSRGTLRGSRFFICGAGSCSGNTT